jgi:hypothetical protein
MCMDAMRDGKAGRAVFAVRRPSDPDDTVAYWLTKTPQERLRHAEELRQVIYAYGDSARMERAMAIAKLGDP